VQLHESWPFRRDRDRECAIAKRARILAQRSLQFGDVEAERRALAEVERHVAARAWVVNEGESAAAQAGVPGLDDRQHQGRGDGCIRGAAPVGECARRCARGKRLTRRDGRVRSAGA
jgi:hypothetical protein